MGTIKLKCRVTSCLKLTDEGICKKCMERINRKPSKKKPIRKVSAATYPKALREAKQAFQLLRRLQESDEKGYCKCVHGAYRNYKGCDGGHLIPAMYLGTCFDPMNVNPQEKHKNMDMMNPRTNKEYVDWFIDKYGQKSYDNLLVKMHVKVKFSVFELTEMKNEFYKEIEMLKIKKGLK